MGELRQCGETFDPALAAALIFLKRLLPKLDQKRKATLLGQQQTRMESLRGELAEFIRKSDYRFRDEIIGGEGDSYKRAADMVKGKHRPENKKDLR